MPNINTRLELADASTDIMRDWNTGADQRQLDSNNYKLFKQKPLLSRWPLPAPFPMKDGG